MPNQRQEIYIKLYSEECGLIPVGLRGPEEWWPRIRECIQRNTAFFNPLPAGIDDLGSEVTDLIVSALKYNAVPEERCGTKNKSGNQCGRERSFDHWLCPGHRRIAAGKPFYRRMYFRELPHGASALHGHGFRFERATPTSQQVRDRNAQRSPIRRGESRGKTAQGARNKPLKVHFGEQDMQQVLAPVCNTKGIKEITDKTWEVTCTKCIWVLREEYNCHW